MTIGRQAWIYTGNSKHEGVDSSSVQNLKSALELNFNDISVLLVGAKSLDELLSLYEGASDTELNKIVVVFPGGKPTLWDSQLGETVSKVRSFICNGGRALMVCAGAYFSAESSSYKVSDSQTIDKQRELRLFPGDAYGPLLPDPGSVTVTCASSSDQVNLLSSGGGFFVPRSTAKEGEDYRVIARYNTDENPIAITSIKVGDGIAVLSFPHFEFNGFPIRESDCSTDEKTLTMKAINRELNKTVAQKMLLVSSIFDELSL